MDKNNYSVDNILEEIKRKKQAKHNDEMPPQSIPRPNPEIRPPVQDFRREVKEYIPPYREEPPVYHKTEPQINQQDFRQSESSIYRRDLSQSEPSPYRQDFHNPEPPKQEFSFYDKYMADKKENNNVNPVEMPENHQIGASVAELMEKEYTTDDNREYFQGGVNDTSSPKIADAFGDKAFKPFETKAAANLKEKHRRKFFGQKEEKTQVHNEQPAYTSEFEERREPHRNEPVRQPVNYEMKPPAEQIPPKREVYQPSVNTSTVAENYENDKTGEKAPFKVNLKDNFFDQNDKENTQMNIKVGNMDSSKAAMGFTRSIPILGTEEEQRKKNAFTFGDGENDKKSTFSDFDSPKDTDEIKNNLKKSQITNLVQLIITAVIFSMLLYWGISLNNTKLPLPSFMLPEVNMQIFVGISLGFLIINTLVCYSVVGGGLISLFTLKPNGDSAAALAVISTILQGVALVALPEKVLQPGVNMYFCLPSLALLFNLIGKTFMYSRIKRNFDFLTNDDEKYTLGLINNKSFEREITRGQNIDTPCVVYSSKTKFPTGFLQFSYSPDYSDGISLITIPIFLGFSVLMAVVSYFFGDKESMVSLTVFSALMCMGAPLTSTWLSNLPLNRISRSLSKEGAMIAGYQSLDDFDEMNALSVDANDLFAGGSIVMHGIKTFSNSRIDEAIIDAASVACSSSGILMDIFMEMIQHKQSLLKKVDSIIYEDEMGLSAWVGGKKVLIGNRNLMINHGMTPPSIEYENKFKKDGKELFYLANSGELTAMFVISYKGSDEIGDCLYELSEKGVTLSVYTTDPNITSAKIEELFDYPQDMVTVMSSKNHAEFNEVSCDKEKAAAKIVYNGNLAAKIKSVCDVISGKSAIVLGTILQLVFIVGGYGLVAFLALMGKTDIANFQLIAIYQLITAFLVILIPNIRKY